eukprot:TRINITY_DN14869_c0_g1_i1.p1 TRINITY_DN14869_c0_g1~~TRINITY_DN14869_c0_g1_i1.p1  ORF type:complete len:445 (-),score=104.66 TRINITY_DN14869_c0_g1_i1:250-1512(-)
MEPNGLRVRPAAAASSSAGLGPVGSDEALSAQDGSAADLEKQPAQSRVHQQAAALQQRPRSGTPSRPVRSDGSGSHHSNTKAAEATQKAVQPAARFSRRNACIFAGLWTLLGALDAACVLPHPAVAHSGPAASEALPGHLAWRPDGIAELVVALDREKADAAKAEESTSLPSRFLSKLVWLVFEDERTRALKRTKASAEASAEHLSRFAGLVNEATAMPAGPGLPSSGVRALYLSRVEAVEKLLDGFKQNMSLESPATADPAAESTQKASEQDEDAAKGELSDSNSGPNVLEAITCDLAALAVQARHHVRVAARRRSSSAMHLLLKLRDSWQYGPSATFAAEEFIQRKMKKLRGEGKKPTRLAACQAVIASSSRTSKFFTSMAQDKACDLGYLIETAGIYIVSGLLLGLIGCAAGLFRSR